MPFIDNVYVTGEVSDRDIKRLTGRRDNYTVTQEILLLAVWISFALVGALLITFRPMSHLADIVVGVILMVAGFAGQLLWRRWNPRARNRARLARYEKSGRIVCSDTMAYKFVMSPRVAAHLQRLSCSDELSDAVDEFVSWYRTRMFASVTPRLLYLDNARELADLQERLEEIGVLLQEKGAQNDMSLHVDKVIAPLIRKRRNELEEGLDYFPEFRDRNLDQISYLDGLLSGSS